MMLKQEILLCKGRCVFGWANLECTVLLAFLLCCIPAKGAYFSGESSGWLFLHLTVFETEMAQRRLVMYVRGEEDTT